jgi:hypothetical protein
VYFAVSLVSLFLCSLEIRSENHVTKTEGPKEAERALCKALKHVKVSTIETLRPLERRMQSAADMYAA